MASVLIPFLRPCAETIVAPKGRQHPAGSLSEQDRRIYSYVPRRKPAPVLMNTPDAWRRQEPAGASSEGASRCGDREQSVPAQLRLASWLCALPGAYAIVAPFALLIPEHAFDKSWTPHQRYHVTWGAGKLLALGINQVLLAFIPLRLRQRWSWFALAANFLFGGLSILVASRLQVGPIPPLRTHDRATRLAFAAMISTAIGLALALPLLFGGRAGKAGPEYLSPSRRSAYKMSRRLPL